jgi:hypothetical protein
MEKNVYTQKQVLYKERMERARMTAFFFDALCNHEKSVYRFSKYSVRGVALGFDEAIPLAQVAHTPEEWCHIWETVYVKLKAYNKRLLNST